MRTACWIIKTTDAHSKSLYFYMAQEIPARLVLPNITITLGHTTLDKTPLDECSARRRDLYLTTHTLTTDRHPCLWRDSNLQPQQVSGHILKPSNARSLDSARIYGNYWSSTSVMVTRTHLNVTLYVQCLFCLPGTFYNTRLFTKHNAHHRQQTWPPLVQSLYTRLCFSCSNKRRISQYSLIQGQLNFILCFRASSK
jgi:hypothetical protein